MNISEVIDSRRKECGFSYAELAARAGLKRDAVDGVCTGSITPSGEQFVQLCVALDLESEDFERARAS